MAQGDQVKLRNDEAELNRLRLRVLQKLVALHHELDGERAEVTLADTVRLYDFWHGAPASETAHQAQASGAGR